MIRDVDQAHAALADALWWLKGFSASQPDGSEARDLANKLRDVREYLTAIAEGSVKRIGDERAVVISYAEFERLIDAFPSSATPAPAEVGHARETVRSVLSAYQAEARDARNYPGPDLPF